MRSLRTFVSVLLLAASTAFGAGFRVPDTTIDAAPNQEILVLGTGVEAVQGMNLAVATTGAPIEITDISIIGTIWEHNNSYGGAVFLYPEYRVGIMYVTTGSGTVDTPGVVGKLIVDATGLGGQTATVIDCVEQPSNFALSGSDGFQPGTITIRAADPPPPNQPPVVNAGADQQVTAGDVVQLSGTATDPEDDPLTFFWMQVAGPEVVLSSRFTANASFTAPEVQSATPFEFQCRVSDGTSTRTDTVLITVEPRSDGTDPQDPPPTGDDDTGDGGDDGGDDGGTNPPPPTGGDDQTPTDPPPSDPDDTTQPPGDDDGDDGSDPDGDAGTQDPPSNNDGTGTESGNYVAPACGVGLADTALLACAGFWLMLLRPLRRSEA